MHQMILNELPGIEVTEQQVADQKRVILKIKYYLTQ